MEESIAGILGHIRDPTLGISGLTKLVRYLWQSGTHSFPNKEQYLLDTVSDCIVERQRKLSSDDSVLLWRCFSEMLLSINQASQNSSAISGFVKSEMIMIMLQQLENCVQDTTDEIVLETHVISSVHSVLKSSGVTLSHIAKFEHLLRLVTSAVQLASNVISCRTDSKSHIQLINAALPLFIAAQRQKSNPHQIMAQVSSKLFQAIFQLAVVIGESDTTQHLEEKDSLKQCIDGLLGLLSTVIFHKDLIQYYELYLNVKYGIKMERAPIIPKFIENFFGKISTNMQSDETKQSTLESLPWLFQQFTKNYRKVSENLPFLFLQFLCKNILQICFSKIEDTEISDQSDVMSRKFISLEDQLKPLSALLDSVVVLDFYDPRLDANEAKLSWLTAVLDWLLRQSTRCSSWFLSLKQLTTLIPSSLEKKLVAVLQSAWPSLLNDDHVTSVAQDEFLTEMIDLYSKLNRMDRLFGKMFESLRVMSDQEMTFPSQFVARLRQSVTLLPEKTTIDTWETFNLELLNIADYSQQSFDSFCHLLSMFLRNIRVSDLIRNEAAIQRFELLCTATLEHLTRLLQMECSAKKLSSRTYSLLFVLFAYGELRLVIPAGCSAHISKLSSQPGKDSAHFCNMSFLYSCLEDGEWMKLHSRITKNDDYKLVFLWEKILGQRLKAVCSSGQARNVQQACKQLLDYLILEKLATSDSGTSAVWDNQVRSVSADNYPVALWSLISQHLFYVYELTADGSTHAYDAVIAEFIVNSISSADESNSDSKHSSVEDMSLSLLSDPVSRRLHTMPSLQSHLITAIILKSIELMHPNDMSAKKKKVSTTSAWLSCVDLLKLLEADANDLRMSTSDGSLQTNPQFFSKLTELLESSADVDSSARSKLNISAKLLKVLKIIQYLPLQYLDTKDQLVCLLFTMVLVQPLSLGSWNTDESREMLRAVVCTMLVVAQGKGKGLWIVLSHLRANVIINFLCCLQLRVEQELRNEVLMLEYAHDITQVVLKHCLLREASLPSVVKLSKKIISQLDSGNVKSRSSISADERDIQPLSVLPRLTIVLEGVTKIMNRHYIRPDLLDSLTQLREKLNAAFYKNLDTSMTLLTEESMSNIDHSVWQTFVQVQAGFTCLLGSRSKQQVDVASDDEELEEDSTTVVAVNPELSTWLPKVCKICVHYLQKSSDDKWSGACIDFIDALCQQSRRGFFTDICQEFVSEIWNISRKQLQTDNSAESNADPTTSSKISKDWTRTMAQALCSFDSCKFEACCQELFKCMEPFDTAADSKRIVLVLEIWNHVTQCGMNQENMDKFYYVAQKILLTVQGLLLEPSCPALIIEASIRVQSRILSFSKGFVTGQDISICLHSFAYSHIWDRPTYTLDEFIRIHTASYELLNSLLIGQSEHIVKMIPAYVQGFKRLLLSLMYWGKQQPGVKLEDHQLNNLKSSALNVERLTSLICEHEVEFAKVASFVIAAYASEAHRVTLYPAIKRTLLFVIYQLLDICNEHAVAQLSTVLPSGHKELFKVIYSDYKNYYKYKGKA